MYPRFNSFLLWMLIALLPLQGLAAAVRTSCGTHAQEITAHTHVANDHGNPHALATHDHAAMLHADATAHNEHPNSPEPTSHSHQHTSAFCNTCGDCCIGSFALPSQVSWALPAPGPSSEVPGAVTLLAGFIPDSLERPPRHTST